LSPSGVACCVVATGHARPLVIQEAAGSAWPPGTIYALRLEAIGNQIRAYVNGSLLLEATAAGLPRGVGTRHLSHGQP
jgi:hypothetical protein